MQQTKHMQSAATLRGRQHLVPKRCQRVTRRVRVDTRGQRVHTINLEYHGTIVTLRLKPEKQLELQAAQWWWWNGKMLQGVMNPSDGSSSSSSSSGGAGGDVLILDCIHSTISYRESIILNATIPTQCIAVNWCQVFCTCKYYMWQNHSTFILSIVLIFVCWS